MDTKFFITFVVITLILELIPMKSALRKINTYRVTDFSDIDDTVTATLMKSGSDYDEEKREHEYWGLYEWYYNGKRRRKRLYLSSWAPTTMTITVNRKTGRYKTPEGQKRIDKITVGITFGAMILGYIIASIICGYSPLFS